jgi:hypothetical protein
MTKRVLVPVMAGIVQTLFHAATSSAAHFNASACASFAERRQKGGGRTTVV